MIHFTWDKQKGKNENKRTQKHSVISDHIFEHGHSMDWENIKILDFEPKYHKR